MSKDYGSWSLGDLKNELRKRKAKVTGKKAVLVQRLEDYDKIFGPLITDSESVFKIVTPSPEHFRDVTTDTSMPLIDFGEMETFCRLTEREDIITSQNMYQEHFLMSCRLAQMNGDYYVTGEVSSEMRKNIVYNVTIKLKSHIILEAQCECAAGMGPYAQCKHVLVLILGLIDLHKNKTIKLKQSITSTLQSFHRPSKLHTGDPVKAEELALKFKDQKYRQLTVFDPRPDTDSFEAYSSNFKKALANYCGQNTDKSVMPMAQILKSADKATIFKDHDYLRNTAEEEFLKQRILTDSQLITLENQTKENRKLWKRERLMRLHSSNFGKICTATKGKLKLAISLVKDIDINTPAIKHGIKYEDEAVRKFENITETSTEKCGIIVHKKYQFLACTPDRLIGSNAVLEVKCPYTAKNKIISPETVTYLYLCEETGHWKLNKEHNYYYQVQGQLMCTERQIAYFCIYTIEDILIIIIQRDNCFIENMLEKLKEFYLSHFKNVLLRRFLYNKNF